jgi:hypothetical protein
MHCTLMGGPFCGEVRVMWVCTSRSPHAEAHSCLVIPLPLPSSPHFFALPMLHLHSLVQRRVFVNEMPEK